MRKFITSVLLLFITGSIFSQSVITTTISFDAALGMTDIGGSAPASAWSRVTAGTFPTISPQAGAGMARFNSYNITSGDRTIATPNIDYSTSGCSYTPTVSFYMYRDDGYATYGDSVSVYINTTASLTGATYINRVARSRTINQPDVQAANGWYLFTFNIPAGFTGASNYLLFKGTSEYGNNTFIDEIQYNTCQNVCSGTPLGGTAGASNTFTCTSPAISTLGLSGQTTSPGITYQWQSSPAGANTFSDIPGATSSSYSATGITASTDYRANVICSNSGLSAFSTIATVTIGGVPANDAPCGAISLVLNGAAQCGNTTCATSTGDPTLACSTPNNTVWHKYTPAANGTVNVKLAQNGINPQLNAWIQFYTATGTCPSLTLTQVNTAACLGSVDLTTVASGTLTSPSLTAGVDYYIIVDGFSGAMGAYCISLETPPAPPLCTTNITPADMATNVSTVPNVSFAWNAAATATSYDLYIGTSVAGAGLVGNFAATTANVTGFSGSTIYYWYVIPKNGTVAATGCSANATSFTTSPICNPSTTNGGTSADGMTDFVLNGESATAISVIAAAPIASPGYIDLTGSTTVTLAAGKAYVGNFKVQDARDYLTIWIDFNNNGGFEAGERVLNNLMPNAAATTTLYSIMIPVSETTGTRKMRVRNVYYLTPPASPTDACSNYSFGESKDFTVNIVASGSAYAVSGAGGGSCASVAFTTIDNFSNNATANVPILDGAGALVARLNAGGNNLGTITSAVFRNTAAVRQDAAGRYYLDRNITIIPATQPAAGNVAVRLYFTAAELAALQAVDPAAVISSLNVTKSPQACGPAYTGSGVFLAQTANGSQGPDSYIEVNTPSFSTFFIARGATVLPVSVDYFRGSKVAGANYLDWKVNCTSSPSVTLILERSADGRNFRSILDQNATATRCQQSFNHTDVSPLAGINYYRLKTVTPDGSFRYSVIVALLNQSKGFELISVAPNPVKTTTVLSITSAKAGKLNVFVSDITGKLVLTQSINVIAGNNPVDLNFASLGAGTYNIKAVNAENITKVARFVKF